MPFALPAAAAAISAAAPAVAAAAAPTLTSTLTTIALKVATNVAISAALSILNPQVGQGGRVSDWTLDPNGPIPFAAGKVGVAGSVIYPETFGPEKMYYGFVTVLSGAGPIKSFVRYRGDDEFVTFNGSGKATSSQWANEMWMTTSLGSQPATALVSPTGLKGGATLPSWTSARKLSGKAAYLVVLGENSKRTAYPTGEPKPMWEIEGLFGWDPRLDSTYPGGAGSCRLDTPSTWVYLENPILWALKWALGLWEGPIGKGAPQVDYQVGGIGAKLSGIDVQAFVSAANVADANGWTVAAYPTTDDDKSQVMDAFLQAGGAIYSQRAGRISCIQRAAPRASIVTLTAADTAGPIRLDTAASRIKRINAIVPSFWSPEHRWQITAMDEVTSSVWTAEDGGRRPRGVTYPYVSDKDQAAQLATLQIANTREGLAGTVPLKPHLQKIRPGDAFTFDEPEFVLNGQKFLCLNTSFDPATKVHNVTFISETDEKYPYALGQTGAPPPSPALVPAEAAVTPPDPSEWAFTAETLTEGAAAVPALVFSGAVDNPRAEQVIFEYRVLDTPERPWAGAGVEDPNVIRKEVTSVTSETIYEGSVAYRIGNRVSERLILGPVTAGVFVPPGGDAPPASALRSSVGSGSVLTTSGATWITWAACAFSALPTGGTFKLFADLFASTGMTLTGGVTFNGNWRVMQNGTAIATGEFTADGEPSILFVVPAAPIAPVQTGATTLTLQVQRASGTNNISGDGVNVIRFYADWTRTG